MSNIHFSLRQSLIASSLAGIFSLSANASILRSDIDYQYFRDFAENKGLFQVGASNIAIPNKQGQIVGTMLPNVPMPDLKVVSRQYGIATLVAPQYVNSVAHNSGYGTVHFDVEGDNPDSHRFEYKVVARNNFSDADYHTPRLHKLVTEIAPVPLSNIPVSGKSAERNIYYNNPRFPYFVRVGSGTQKVVDEQGNLRDVTAPYQFLTGGVPLSINYSIQNWISAEGNVYHSKYGPMATYGTPGDSGSPLFAFDKQENRWVLAGVLATWFGDQEQHNMYNLVYPSFVQSVINDDVMAVNNTSPEITLTPQGNQSLLITRRGVLHLDIADPAKTGLDTEVERPSLEHGKTLRLTGETATINISHNMNQGAGALHFGGHFTVKGATNDITWTGAGVIVDKDRVIHWQVKNPEGDRLSKLGEGQLYVDGQGENLGDISVGEGTVVLAQRALNGKTQAFKQVGIVSGRPTVVLNDDKQVNPDNIYFGFRGGRLDLNGNALTFNRIQNADDGARIVNHNRNKIAHLTNKAELSTFSGYLGETDPARQNARLDVTYAPHSNQGVWLLNGGLKLNGALNVEKGTVVLSGRTVPHAYDHLNHREIINNDEWMNRTFQAINFNVKGQSTLAVGRNVSQVLGHFNAYDNAKLQLGFAFNGSSPNCVRSDIFGRTSCEMRASLDSNHFAALPTTNIVGDVALAQNSQLSLGKAHLRGDIHGTANTLVNLGAHSHWTMNSSSQVGNLSFEPQSTLTLNNRFESNDVNESNTTFNRLTVNGNLSGNGHIQYLTNAAAEKGDQIVVNGVASGSFLLSLRNIGKEPSTVSPLSLMKLNNPQQHTQNLQVSLANGFVDLGAYRYILANKNNDYRLYNPLRDAQLSGATNDPAQSKLLEQLKAEAAQIHQQMEQKLRELTQLTQRYEQSKQQKQTQQAKLDELAKAAINAQHIADQTFHKYNSMRRVRFITRAILANRFKQEMEVVHRYQNQYRELKNQSGNLDHQLQIALDALNEAKKYNAQLGDKQTDLNKQINELQNSNSAFIGKARQLCEAQQLSSQVCNQVLRLANSEELTPAEALFAEKAAALEQAEAALALAEQQNNLSDIANLKAALAKAQREEAQAFLDLNASETMVRNAVLNATALNSAMPTQGEAISQYANTALSDLSASVNSLLQVGRNLDRHLLSDDNANVWVNTEYNSSKNSSENYRTYEQNLSLTQIGVAKEENNIQVGAVLSHSRGNNQFDDNATGKTGLTLFSAYLKAKWENGVFATFDLNAGRSQHKITLQEQEVKFHRHLFGAGANLGVALNWQGIQIQPSAGLRYYRLSGVDYELDQAQVQVKPLNLMTYNLGLKLAYSMDWQGVKFTPNFASSYNYAKQRAMRVDGKLQVNNIGLHQQFGTYFDHRIGLDVAMKNWKVGAHLGLIKGSEIKQEKYAGLKVGYTF